VKGEKGQRPKRADRVAERLRAELMELLLRGAVRDPAVEGCFISAVELSDDLQHARIYVRMGDGQEGDAAELRGREAVAALERAAGFIQRRLSPRLELKYQPRLRFYWDRSVDQARRVDELLDEIASDRED